MITLVLFLSRSLSLRLWVHSQLCDTLTLTFDRCWPLPLVVLLIYVTRSLIFEVALTFEVMSEIKFSRSIDRLKLCSWVCFKVFYLHSIFRCKQVLWFARSSLIYFGRLAIRNYVICSHRLLSLIVIANGLILCSLHSLICYIKSQRFSIDILDLDISVPAKTSQPQTIIDNEFYLLTFWFWFIYFAYSLWISWLIIMNRCSF